MNVLINKFISTGNNFINRTKVALAYRQAGDDAQGLSVDHQKNTYMQTSQLKMRPEDIPFL